MLCLGSGQERGGHFSAGEYATAASHRRTGRQVRTLILTLCALSLLVDFPTNVFFWKTLTLKSVVALAAGVMGVEGGRRLVDSIGGVERVGHSRQPLLDIVTF